MLHQSFKVFDVDFGLKKLLDIQKGFEINNIAMDTIDPQYVKDSDTIQSEKGWESVDGCPTQIDIDKGRILIMWDMLDQVQAA